MAEITDIQKKILVLENVYKTLKDNILIKPKIDEHTRFNMGFESAMSLVNRMVIDVRLEDETLWLK